jgi:hypothetical protein
MNKLPEHPKDFSADWLADALGFQASDLAGFDFSPIGTGQMADSFRLELDWRADMDRPSDAPKTVVAKCPALDAQSRETGRLLHNYEVEVKWYQEFAAAAEVRTPYCYRAEIAPNMTEFVLLMEDLAPASQGNQIAGAADEDIQKVLLELANLHRFKWQDPSLEKNEWLNYSKGNREFIRAFVPQSYDAWQERYQDRLDPEILKMGRSLADRFDAYLEPRDAPQTITHGDCRLDNVLFSDAAGRAVIVDWQTISAGPAMGDVAYCIGTSFSDAHARADKERDLLTFYLQALQSAENNSIDYSFEAAWVDYRYSAFSGFLMAVIAAMLVERTDRGDEMFAVMAERSGYQALHLDSLALV